MMRWAVFPVFVFLAASSFPSRVAVSSQPVAPPVATSTPISSSANSNTRFGGPADNPTSLGVQVNYEFSESTQLSPERWNDGWRKVSGVAARGAAMLVYLNSETCRQYVSSFNRTCLKSESQRALFFPQVDHFSRLEINNSFNAYSNDTEFVIWLSVKNGTDPSNNTINTFALTSKKHYTDSRGQYVVGSYTAFITMKMGKPTGIEWEEGCDECFRWCSACRPQAPSAAVSTDTATTRSNLNCDGTADGEYRPYQQDCSPGRCIDNLCAVSRAWECATNTTTCTKCDDQTCNIKIYIGWKGTDADGRVLTSFGSVPSTFRKFSFSPSYRQAVGIWSREENFLLVGG